MKPRILSAARLTLPLARAIAGLALAAFPLNSLHAQTTGNWSYNGTVAASNNWNTTGSWTGLTGGLVPNAIGATANFTFNITAARTITLNGDKTVGTLTFDDPTSTFGAYTLGAGTPTTSRLILDAASGSAAINTQTAANTVTNVISVPITLNDPLVVTTNRNNVAGGVTLGGVISDGDASLSITKNGNGNLVLNNANEYDGGTIINAGRVQAGNASAMGSGSVTIASGGQFYTATAATFANDISVAGNGYANTSDTAALLGAIRYQNSTTTGTITLTGNTRVGAFGGGTGTLAGTLTGGAFDLEINSTANTNHNGNIVLTGNAAGLTGTVTVSQGTLSLGTNSNLGGNLVVADGANLYGDSIGSPGAAVLAGNLTLGNPGSTTGANLFIDPATNDALQVNGNLTLNGTTTVTLAGPPTGSTVTVMKYAGTLIGDVSNLALPGAVTDYRTGTGFAIAANQVTLNLVTANLKWTGLTSDNWNTIDANWSDGNPSTFYNFDSVTFDDSGAAYPNVILPADVSVSPSSITFNHSAVDYSLTGTGAITGGATLTKTGTGQLTLSTANSFAGGTTLNAGTVRVGNAAAFGTGPLTITGIKLASDGATARNLANPANLGGTITLGDATDSGAITFSGATTLTADTTLIGDAPNTVSNTISGVITDGENSFRLTKSGTAHLILGSANSYDGGTTIELSRIQANNINALGTGTVSILSGGQAWFNAGGTNTNNFQIEGTGWTEGSGNLGALRLQSGINLTGSITLTGDARITAHGNTATLSGNIAETGGARVLELANFNTATNSTITVAGNNTHSGGTTVTGAIVVASSSTAFGTGPVTTNDANPTRSTSVQLGTDLTIANDFVLNSSAPTATAAILSNAGDLATASLATVTGDIEILKSVGGGGHLASTKGSNSVLRVTGAITSPNGVSVVVRQGLVELAGGGNYEAIQIVDGTLRNAANNGLASNAVLSVGTSGTSGDSGTYDLNGFDQTLAGLLNNGVRPASVINNGATPSVLTLNTPGSGTYAGSFGDGASALNLLKTGPGTLTFSASSPDFPDNLTVSGGTLEIGATFGSSASTGTITTGGAIGGSGTFGGDLTFTGGAIAVEGLTPLGLLTSGTLNVSGGVSVDLRSLPATPGPIEVIAFNGILTGGLPNFSMLNPGAFRNPQFQLNANNVTLTLGDPVNLTWTGSGGNTWDINTTTNWVNEASAPGAFLTADNAIFGNVGSGTVLVPSNLPITNWVINSSENWLFEGAGTIFASSLTKDGTGSADVATPWVISGPINLLAGSLKLSTPAATTQTITNVLTGAGTLIKGGAGTFSFPQANTGFSGSLVIANGEVVLGTETSLGSAPAITFGDASTLPADIATLRLPASGVLGTPSIVVAPTCLDARVLTTGTTLDNTAITKRGTGTLYLGHASTYSIATNFLTGTPSLLIEKGNIAFTSRTPFAAGTPVTLGNLNSGTDDTVLEVPRSSGQDQLVMSPAITLGTLAEGATSQAILRYSGSALGTTSNGAPTVSGTLDLNGRDIYLENTSPDTGGTSRLWNYSGAISGNGNVRIRTWANPDGTNSGAGRVRLQNAGNAWTGDLYLDRGHVQVGTASQCIPDTARIIFSPGTAVTLFNGTETVRGLVGGAATEEIPFPATLSVNAGGVLAHTMILNDPEATNTHVFSGIINNGVPTNSTITLVKNGAATQVLTGANTFSGDITVNGGTLVGAGSVSGGGGVPVLGARSNTRTFTINDGATLRFDSGNITASGYNQTTAPTLVINSGGTVTNGGIATNSALNNVVLNGGTLTSTTGHVGSSSGIPVYGAWNLNGAVTSTGTSTISTTAPDRGWVMLKVPGDATTNFNVVNGTLTVSAPLVDNPTDNNIGSLRKSGDGTMILTAANTYRGTTTVSQGTLAFVGGSQTAPVTVEAGASIGFTIGSPTSSTGTFDLSAGTVKITGTPTLASHDLITSSAGITGTPTLDAPVPGYELLVDGTSLKLVQALTSGYASWAALNGAGANLDDDHDNDGVANGIEYFIGGPNGNTTGMTTLPTVVSNAGLLTVTWPKGAGYTGVYGTDFFVETSTTLSGPWTTEELSGNVTDSPASVIFTFPGGPAYTDKRFARLRVVGP
jgi:autotransporter-associated beta strand protein